MKVHEMSNTLFTEVSKLGNIDFLTTDVAGILDFEYFNVHSYSKYVLPFVDALKESQPDNYIQQIAKIVNLKFKDKWQKLYDVLIGTEYVPINNYQESETETPNITKTKEGTNSDTRTGSENIESTEISSQKEGTDVTTTGDNQQDNLIYGFNSNVGVGDTERSDNSSSNISGNKEDNTIDINKTDTSEKTKNETTQHSINESEKETGTRTYERSGLKGGSYQELIEKEVNLKNRYNLFNILYQDVDSIIALMTY